MNIKGRIALNGFALIAGGVLLKWLSDARCGRNVPGRAKSPAMLGLELGAKLLQSRDPLREFNLHVVGFHPLKDEPRQQMLAHHYCRIVNEDFMQCLLFDGDGADARLHGVEYIISERLFDSLPHEEKQYWHPHNHEILSGQLIAPHVPEQVERELMRRLMNSYGKTWHVWASGHPDRAADPLPYGPARLAWSFNHDGEVEERLVEARDRKLGVSTRKRRKLRAGLSEQAHRQEGEDVLRQRFESGAPAPGGSTAHHP